MPFNFDEGAKFWEFLTVSVVWEFGNLFPAPNLGIKFWEPNFWEFGNQIFGGKRHQRNAKETPKKSQKFGVCGRVVGYMNVH